MRWIAYDPNDTEKKNDELSDEDLDEVSGGGGTTPPPPGHP
jgi:hypothetical protein